MGTVFSGSSNVVGSGVTLVAARATGQRRVITHLTAVKGSTATYLDIEDNTSGLSLFRLYSDISGVDIPPFAVSQGIEIGGSGDGAADSFMSISGYDSAVGEDQGFFSAYAEEKTANGTQVFATLRAPLSSTEVLAVHKVMTDSEASSNQKVSVGYADDAVGSSWVDITPQKATAQVYDLGALEIPAGKYLLILNDESAAGGAKGSTAIVSGRILKP